MKIICQTTGLVVPQIYLPKEKRLLKLKIQFRGAPILPFKIMQLAVNQEITISLPVYRIIHHTTQ
jgi:hypothetical protein